MQGFIYSKRTIPIDMINIWHTMDVFKCCITDAYFNIPSQYNVQVALIIRGLSIRCFDYLRIVKWVKNLKTEDNAEQMINLR